MTCLSPVVLDNTSNDGSKKWCKDNGIEVHDYKKKDPYDGSVLDDFLYDDLDSNYLDRIFILDIFARFVSKTAVQEILAKMEEVRTPLAGCESFRGNGTYIYAAPHVMCFDVSWVKLEGLKLAKIGHPLNYIKNITQIKEPQALDVAESLSIKALNEKLHIVYFEHYKKKNEGYSYYFLNKKTPIIQYAGKKADLLSIWKKTWQDEKGLLLCK